METDKLFFFKHNLLIRFLDGLFILDLGKKSEFLFFLDMEL